MSRKGKKYNRMDKAKMTARVGLRNLAVWNDHRDNSDESYQCTMVNFKSAKKVSIGVNMARIVERIRFKWKIYLVVTGIDIDGDYAVDHEVISPSVNGQPVELLHSDLTGFINERHGEFANEFLSSDEIKELSNIIMIASPNGDDISDMQIFNLVNDLGAW